jgi:hypothetical protein
MDKITLSTSNIRRIEIEYFESKQWAKAIGLSLEVITLNLPIKHERNVKMTDIIKTSPGVLAILHAQYPPDTNPLPLQGPPTWDIVKDNPDDPDFIKIDLSEGSMEATVTPLEVGHVKVHQWVDADPNPDITTIIENWWDVTVKLADGIANALTLEVVPIAPPQ